MGYVMGDNASNNDKLVRALPDEQGSAEHHYRALDDRLCSVVRVNIVVVKAF